MSIPINIEVTSASGLTRKEYLRAATGAWRATGAHWHREILPKHFLRRAIATYHYQERGDGYEKTKQRKWGHKRPLVWSGTMRSELTANRSLVSRRAGVSIHVSGRLNLSGHNKRARMPDMSAEIQAVSPEDERELSAVLEKDLVKRLSAPGKKRKV